MTSPAEVDDRAVHSAVNDVIDRVLDFDEGARRRIFRTAETFLFGPGAASSSGVRGTSFAQSKELPPKDFLLQKQPKTDVERAACLAYYLTHYRETPHFKTLDLSLLNTEAGQIKFSNTAAVIATAARAGLLGSADNGTKKLTAQGERFVDALPDRAAAKEVQAAIRNRRGRAKSSKNNKRSAG